MTKRKAKLLLEIEYEGTRSKSDMQILAELNAVQMAHFVSRAEMMVENLKEGMWAKVMEECDVLVEEGNMNVSKKGGKTNGDKKQI